MTALVMLVMFRPAWTKPGFREALLVQSFEPIQSPHCRRRLDSTQRCGFSRVYVACAPLNFETLPSIDCIQPFQLLLHLRLVLPPFGWFQALRRSGP